MIKMFRKGIDRAVLDAKHQIEVCGTLPELVDALSRSVRAIVKADGVTVTQREHDQGAYISSDAIVPLWAGRMFPIRLCVTGQAMLERAPVVIADVALEGDLPLNAYIATYARSIVAVPIGGGGEPMFALGAFWRNVQPPSPRIIARLEELAASAAVALSHILGTPLAPDRRAA